MIYGDGSIHFEHRGPCTDARHRNCKGRWKGQFSFEGTRYVVTSAVSKKACSDKMDSKRSDLEMGIVPDDSYTVEMAVRDWLKNGLPGRDPKTIKSIEATLKGILPLIGHMKLKKITGDNIRDALAEYGKTRAQATVGRVRNDLERAIRYAQSRRKVGVNMAEMVENIPVGHGAGRPSKSFTPEQTAAILKAAVGVYPMDGYVYLGLGTGIRTEESRALLWTDLHLDGDDPMVAIVRSVRSNGEVKTTTSKRGVPLMPEVVDALKRHRLEQRKQRLAAGEMWEDTEGLVFTTALGVPFYDSQVKYLFQKFLRDVPGVTAGEWTPRELRHTFASVLDFHDVPTAEVSRLMGHSKVSTTETVYRHDLKVRRTGGDEAIAKIFAS